MRIEGPNRSSGVSARGAVGKTGTGIAFVPQGAPETARATVTAPLVPAAGLDALLALQAVGSSTEGRRRTVRRGRALLDQLDAIKADLLLGRVEESRLDALVGQLAQLREHSEPGLDAVLDDIELRVRVELAKFGRYPAV